MPQEMPKVYKPAEHEDRIRARWDASGAFHADPSRVLSGERQPYAILIPPPNVTAALHLGHALNNSIQDILVRAHRMKGFETIWLPGTDHAGIATQTVVDKRLKESGKPALADYKKLQLDGENGREQFIAQVQAWKDEYELRITDQLKAMGCSCDWDRQRFTMDDICARAVRESFFQLFKDGLIYRGKRLVNWDPVTQTALADDEVENKDVKGSFYYLRYPLCHKPRNPSDPQDVEPVTWSELAARGYPGADSMPDDERAWVTVATTRPETYLGDTAVAVNPGDPRAGALRDFMVELPLVGRIIPIVQDDYVVMPDPDSSDVKAKYATGFLKVTPAHDPNDWEIGHRHDLAVINVMAPDASISNEFGWDDYEPNAGAHVFLGRSREDARKLVVKEFEARNLLEEVRPYEHSVGHSYRSHVPIEPYLSDQWYVRVTNDALVGSAQRAVVPDQRSSNSHLPNKNNPNDGHLRFYPSRYARTYESWHDNLRDWCISRQLWWGHQIPVWRTVENLLEKIGIDAVGEFLSPLLDWEEQGRVTWQLRGEHVPLESIEKDKDDLRYFFVCVRDPDNDPEIVEYLERAGLERDPDVLDTWYSSGLWPLSTMGWPEVTQSDDVRDLLEAFNPTSVLCTAREIITLWVSRMVMFNRYFKNHGLGEGDLPFSDVFIHAMIQDGEGRKMSKSLGNGVDPLDIIHSHGADALRFTLCQMTTQTQDVRMPVERDEQTGRNTSPKFDLGRNFSNKIWNAARFTISMLSEAGGTGFQPVEPSDLTLPDRWMLSRLASASRELDSALSEYQFSVYADTLYGVFWRDFCDWYLEAVKPTVKDSPAQQAVLRAALDALLRFIHPVMPFVTETVYETLRDITGAPIDGLSLPDPTHDGLLCTAGWPTFDSALDDESSVRDFERFQSLITAVREVRAKHQVKPRQKITLHANAELAKQIASASPLVETLAGLGTVTTDAPDGPSVAFTFESGEYHLSELSDAVDSGAERERLEKQLAELDKSIDVLDKRLSNPGYVEKAPAHMVEQTRGELEKKKADRDAVSAQLERLA